MVRRGTWVNLVAVAIAMVMTAVGHAQMVVQNGPPPELRKHMDAFVKAFNSGDAAEWEKMAQATCTPEYLKKATAEQRKSEYKKMHDTFGTIAIQQVERQGGPDAPLQVFVKGSTASGVFWIDLDDALRFDSLKAEVRKGS